MPPLQKHNQARFGDYFSAGKLKAAGALSNAVLKSLNEALVVTDKDGKIVLVNTAFERMFGWGQKEVKGKKLVEAVAMEDKKKNRIPPKDRIIAKVLSGKKVATGMFSNGYYLVRRDGTRFPVIIGASPVILDGKIIGVAETFQDITKEKEIDEAKNDFLSTASHQLKAPLMGIDWVLERMMKKENFSKEGEDYIKDIHEEINRLSELVDLLLNVSRIEAGVKIEISEFDAVKLVKEYLLTCRPRAAAGNLRVKLKKSPKKLIVKSDKNILRLIIAALISNAIEYSLPGGKVNVFLSLSPKAKKFLLRVEDKGIGIPQEAQGRIFEKFFRADNAKSVRTDGTGLGLYIVSESVKLLGGKVWFESEENKGSSFFAELPVRSASPEEK